MNTESLLQNFRTQGVERARYLITLLDDSDKIFSLLSDECRYLRTHAGERAASAWLEGAFSVL